MTVTTSIKTSYKGLKYCYGFNGMEKDDEVKGEGNSYTTLFRQYDPRIGRWLSLDPKMAEMPWQSPYISMDGNPIAFMDPLGDKIKLKEKEKTSDDDNKDKTKEEINYTTEVKDKKLQGKLDLLSNNVFTVKEKDGYAEIEFEDGKSKKDLVKKSAEWYVYKAIKSGKTYDMSSNDAPLIRLDADQLPYERRKKSKNEIGADVMGNKNSINLPHAMTVNSKNKDFVKSILIADIKVFLGKTKEGEEQGNEIANQYGYIPENPKYGAFVYFKQSKAVIVWYDKFSEEKEKEIKRFEIEY